MDKKVAELLVSIKSKGYIGAGPTRLENDINFIALEELAKEEEQAKEVKPAKVVAPKVVALPVRKIVRHK